MAARDHSKTAYVILGMLALGRKTGYDIKSLVDVSTRFFWAASYGQIYPELKRLEATGLIRGEDDGSDGRRKRAYELTPAGREALHDWLTSDEPMVRELRHEGVLKLFFSDVLTPEEQLAQLRRIRAEHEEMRARLEALEPGAREADEARGLRFTLLTLDWGISYQDAIIDWCERAERELQAVEA
ncbi:MAG TPA: PadR family transcriptional regulator [Thermoleophilaceae bacterium]|jgi:DNA-binding PadR family transcriptional regulator